jgi:23S rRNA G2445 N2-methylase RlmL
MIPLAESFSSRWNLMPNKAKELYSQLRVLPWKQLWNEEAARFDQAPPRERIERVAVIRAVGVVFSEAGVAEQSEAVRRWMRGLLHDPVEKVRRYAMAALPKIGAGPEEEAELLSLLRTTASEREKQFLMRTLEKIGGRATLEILEERGSRRRRDATLGAKAALKIVEEGEGDFLRLTEQKVKASLARRESPSAIRMDGVLSDLAGARIHLRGRRGLEGIVRDEVEASLRAGGKFRVAGVESGLVAITPLAPFSLADIYAHRCFGTAGFVLGDAAIASEAESAAALAKIIASPLSRRIFEAFTRGTIRYRLNFMERGHQRSAVRLLAGQVYDSCPEMLNDGRNVTWTMDIYGEGRARRVELRPNLTPDPRFYYRLRDVPAASHPPLAACMARLAGRVEHEIIWDPFCGSGLELIESALLGGVERIHGTDRSAAAIAIARDNLAAAKVDPASTKLACCDFRDFAAGAGLGPGRVTLLITNPPMGRRVPIADLRGLMEDLFAVAATVLRPGGRLVLANPLFMETPHPPLQLRFRQAVDFGGFDCRLEMYQKR